MLTTLSVHSCLCTIALLAGLSTARSTVLPAPPNDPISLFDGKAVESANWKFVSTAGGPPPVSNGAIELGGSAGTLWYTKRTFRDFLLTVEWKAESADSVAGVWVRCPKMTPDQSGAERGHRVILHDGGKNAALQTGAIVDAAAASAKPARPGDWNTLEVMVTDENYQVSVNGQIVSRYVCEHSKEGFLGLVGEPGGKTWIRSARIAPLDAAPESDKPSASLIAAPSPHKRLPPPKDAVQLPDGHYALIAAAAGDAVVVRQYLNKGGDPNAHDSSGVSLMHLAAAAKRPNLVTILLDKRAYVDPMRKDGATPLHLAAATDSLATVQALVAGGADPELEDESGQMPVDVARKASRTEIVKFLESKAPSVSLPPPAKDWNQWRGPIRTGVAPASPSLMPEWLTSAPSKAWQVRDLPYGGSGCVSLSGGKLYSYLHDYAGEQDVIVCLDSATGRQIWIQKYKTHHVFHEASGSPCVIGDRVYVMGARNAFCLETETGKLVWQRYMGGRARDRTVSQEGQEHSTSFALIGDKAILCAGDTTALDIATGAPRWYSPEAGGYAGTMTSLAFWQKRSRIYGIYVGNYGLFCIDPVTGGLYWTTGGTRAGIGFASSPAVDGDLCAVTAWDELRVYQLTTIKPTLVWKAPITDNYSSPVIWNSHVYTVGKNGRGTAHFITCRDLMTGKIAWAREVDRPEYSSPIIAEGKLFALVENGATLVMVDASPAGGGKVLGQLKVDAFHWTSPVLSGGFLYLRTPGGFACYDLRVRDGNQQ